MRMKSIPGHAASIFKVNDYPSVLKMEALYEITRVFIQLSIIHNNKPIVNVFWRLDSDVRSRHLQAATRKQKTSQAIVGDPPVHIRSTL
jgi:hypothetical protein